MASPYCPALWGPRCDDWLLITAAAWAFVCTESTLMERSRASSTVLLVTSSLWSFLQSHTIKAQRSVNLTKATCPSPFHSHFTDCSVLLTWLFWPKGHFLWEAGKSSLTRCLWQTTLAFTPPHRAWLHFSPYHVSVDLLSLQNGSNVWKRNLACFPHCCVYSKYNKAWGAILNAEWGSGLVSTTLHLLRPTFLPQLQDACLNFYILAKLFNVFSN